MPDKKPNNSKTKKKEEKSILELRPWEKDDYIPNPTASIYPYSHTPKINKYGFLTKVPVSFMPSLLVGGIGAEFPRKGINANIVGTKFLSDDPNFKVGIGGGISKKFGKLNAGLEIGDQPKINLKYNFENGGDIVSQLGYKNYSPFNKEPFLKINTPTGYIDMNDVDTDIYANGKFLPKNSGLHYMGTDEVLEVPVNTTYDNGGDLTPEQKVKATNDWFTVRPWLGDMAKYEPKPNSKLTPYMHEIGQNKTPSIYVPYAGVNINPEDYTEIQIPGGYTVYQDNKSGKYIVTDPEYYENSDSWEWMQDKRLLGKDKVAIRYGNQDIYNLIADPTESYRGMMEENYPELLNQDWYKQFLLERGLESEVLTYGGKVPNIPTWNYPSKGTPIYRDTTEIPPNQYQNGEYLTPGEKALQSWHSQAMTTWNPEGTPISETSDVGKQTLQNWWSQIGREDYSTLAAEGKTPHWSALAMSLSEQSMLGANNAEEAKAMGFQPSSAHSTYIRNAFKTSADPNYKYNALIASPIDNNINIGDIYFYGRKQGNQDASNWEFDDFKNTTEHYPSHADRVISKGKDKGGEYVIFGGGNNRYDSYGEKKVYLKNLKNKYKGKLVRNINSSSLPKERFEIIAKTPDKVDPIYKYISEVPEHKETIKNLNHSTNLKLEELPNLIRFTILEGLRTNKYTKQQAKEEINIALKDKNAYLKKLLKPAMFRQAKVNFSKGSALGKSRM